LGGSSVGGGVKAGAAAARRRRQGWSCCCSEEASRLEELLLGGGVTRAGRRRDARAAGSWPRHRRAGRRACRGGSRDASATAGRPRRRRAGTRVRERWRRRAYELSRTGKFPLNPSLRYLYPAQNLSRSPPRRQLFPPAAPAPFPLPASRPVPFPPLACCSRASIWAAAIT
jgi:hypothetical protein